MDEVKREKAMIKAKKVKALRKATGLSQAKFGEMLSIPVANISFWEVGRTSPPDYALGLLQEVLKYRGYDVDLSEFDERGTVDAKENSIQ